jgi:hypothetical protein
MTDPEPKPRSVLVLSTFVGGLWFAGMGVIAGYTGLSRTRYPLSPLEQAALVGFLNAPPGALLGCVIGGIVDLVRWWLWRQGRGR